MKSSDWVALVGVLISCLAFGVAYLAYRLQAQTARSDSEQELADQIDAIHAHLADLDRMAAPGGSMASIIQNANVNAALQALLLRASNLVAAARLSPDWYQNLVLASAALQIGDVLTAAPYAEQAVALAGRRGASGWAAGAGTAARVISLRTRAWLYFTRGLAGDLDRARGDYEAARRVVEDVRDGQGPNLTSVQLVELYVRQADYELDVGDGELGAELMRQAAQIWLGLRAPGARREAGRLISALAQQRGSAHRLLTGDFVREWNTFLREQGGAAGAAVSAPYGFPAPAASADPTAHSAVLPGLDGLRPIRIGRAAAPAAGMPSPADPDR
jgi:hypothetical protein